MRDNKTGTVAQFLFAFLGLPGRINLLGLLDHFPFFIGESSLSLSYSQIAPLPSSPNTLQSTISPVVLFSIKMGGGGRRGEGATRKESRSEDVGFFFY